MILLSPLRLLGVAALLGTLHGAAAAPRPDPMPEAPASLARRATVNSQMVFAVSSSAFQVQCLNSQITIFINLNIAVTMAGVTGLLPMGETGLPVIDMAFFVGGKAATVTVPSSYNVNPSTASGNTWSFGLLDDQPNVGGQINLGACTSAATIGAVTASFSTKTVITGQGLADRGVPVLSGIPTIVNSLAAANVASTTTTTTTTTTTASPSSTPSKKATPTPTPSAASTTGSIVITLAADTGQNGGLGINVIQCQNGKITTTVNLQVSTNVNNIHAYQPMAETGLPVIDMAFFVAGKAATVGVQGTFNVGSSSSSGNVWSFALCDDCPHPGGQFTLGTCTNAASIGQITASFTTTTFIVGQGLPNGADGGPAVPAVSGVATLVNALPSQFVAAATTTTTTASASPTPSKKASVSASPSSSPASSSSSTTTLDGNCVLTYPNTQDDILSAAGLATPWTVTAGCDQTADTPSFIQGTIFDPETGDIFVYNPLVINAGSTPAITPTVPTIPDGAIVTLHFGTNGCSTTLADASGGAMLAAANCVNGGGADNSIFGQFAYCNALNFFTAVNANLGILNPAIPALGTDKTGLTCTTTRSFGLVDQDPSDNVVTAYLLTSDNLMAQNTTANQAALTKAGKTFNIITNGSDNRLNLIINGVVGCTSYMAPDLANNNALAGSLALNEIMAATRQQAPVAKIPITDPMVLMADGNVDTTGAKLALYRQGVNENFANAANLGNGMSFCSHLATIAPTYMAAWAAAGLTNKAPSPDAGTGTNLATFLGARFQAAWGLLDCTNQIGVSSPVTCFDANGNAAGDNPAAKCTIVTTVSIAAINDPYGDDQPGNISSDASFTRSSIMAVLTASLVSAFFC